MRKVADMQNISPPKKNVDKTINVCILPFNRKS